MGTQCPEDFPVFNSEDSMMADELREGLGGFGEGGVFLSGLEIHYYDKDFLIFLKLRKNINFIGKNL